MRDAKHTPAPWHVSNGVQIRSTRHQIAKVWMMRDGEGNANALLIAAAPELLADLEEAAATMRRYETLHRANGTPESDEKADAHERLAAQFEATIAKAKGQTS